MVLIIPRSLSRNNYISCSISRIRIFTKNSHKIALFDLTEASKYDKVTLFPLSGTGIVTAPVVLGVLCEHAVQALMQSSLPTLRERLLNWC